MSSTKRQREETAATHYKCAVCPQRHEILHDKSASVVSPLPLVRGHVVWYGGSNWEIQLLLL